VGTILLRLPWSQTRDDIGLVDALFTATSAVCVSGLIVVGPDFVIKPSDILVMIGKEKDLLHLRELASSKI
jgi:hypothetical protein